MHFKCTRVLSFIPVLILLAFTGFAQESGAGMADLPDNWYEGKPIREIAFGELVNVAQSDLDGIVQSFIGRVFTEETYMELYMALLNTDYFSELSPQIIPYDENLNGVIVSFTVIENPIAARITFSGNRHLRARELTDAIAFKRRQIITDRDLRAAEQAIVRKYRESGYPDASATAEYNESSSSPAVNFRIEEGSKITLREIVINGNSKFTDSTLKRQMGLKEKRFYNDGAFEEEKLVEDQEKIIRYYHDRGYIDMEIIDVQSNMQKDSDSNNNLIITYNIREGSQYLLGDITFEGNQIFTTEQLNEQITSLKKTGLGSGRVQDRPVVNASKVEADLQRVADLYYENGYIYNTINRVETREQGVVYYKLEIVERGRAHIESISVQGNEKTQDQVILREIPLEPGDIFSKAKIQTGMRNLYNLQFFSGVNPVIEEGTAGNLMKLVMEVEEQPSTDLQFGLTFSGTADPNTFPISVMFKLNDRNLLGTGNSLGVEVTGSPDTANLTLSHNRRWIFGLPVNGGIDFSVGWSKREAEMDNIAPFFNGDEDYAFPDGFYSYDDYYNSGKNPPDKYLMPYDHWNLSLGFNTGYRFYLPAGVLALGGGFRPGIVFNKFDEGLYRPFDPVLRENNNRWTPFNSVWGSVSLDNRDLFYDPSDGYYAIQRLGIYGLFDIENEHYIRSDTKAEFFHTILSKRIVERYTFKLIFGIHTGLSFLFPQPFQAIEIQKASRLAVDGIFNARGWSGEYYNKGLSLWENWMELRIPIVPQILAWDFFLDGAGVKKTPELFFSKFSIEDMRFSLGGGLRFALPQFPFRFSFAKRFKINGDGSFDWQRGAIFYDGSNPLSGVDFVLSFAMSTY
ncbi:MAG: outer membrane protein assembly factor BamA [Treponema sp.]|nr:outer membrane protein assembly factor BamA [Treponema sp.]